METTTNKTKRSGKALEWTEIATALGCNVKQARSRVSALGYLVPCNRCGGSGRYSYCQMYGDTCFGCAGSGKAFAKITAATLDEIKGKIAAGALDEYFARAKRAAEARAATNAIKSEIDATWKTGAVHAMFAARHEAERRLNDYNARKAHLHETVTSQLFNAVEFVNAAWSASNDIRDRAVRGKMSAEAALAEMTEVRGIIAAANAYAAEHAAEMMTPAVNLVARFAGR